MRYAFYPGCSMHASGRDYLESFMAISGFFGIDFEKIKEWTCCAPIAAHGVSRLLSIAIPAKNLAEVEKEGKNEVVVPCAACYSRFKVASYEISNDKEIAMKVNDCIGYNFKNTVRILHPLEIFNDIKKDFIMKDFSKINVVCYYGCLLTRPPKVKQFDICENPRTMDDILRELGFNVLDWSYKTDCCGTTFNLTKKDVFLRLTGRILSEAKLAGADIIAVACPLCQVNLDSYQLEFKEPDIPVLYFTQLIGLAYGISPHKLGLNRVFVEPERVIERCLKR